MFKDGSITGGPHHKVVGNLDTPLKELEENINRLSEKLKFENVHQVADGIH